MDDFDMLHLQKARLEKELELIQIKLEIVSLERKTEHQKVDISPYIEICKNEASPEPLVSGKDGLNPLVVVLLESKTEVQTSVTLVKPSDLNLRPNGRIQIPNKTKEQSLVIPYGSKSI